MSVDSVQGPEYWQEEGESSGAGTRVLTSEHQIILHSDMERQAYQALVTKVFEHTKVYSEDLLDKTGMRDEFEQAFAAIGWGNFWRITEPGSKLLTLEFLSTMVVYDHGVGFRLFNEEFFGSWEELSTALGFDSDCTTNTHFRTLSSFSRESFWTRISGQESCSAPRTNDIHNPTLRFLHKWIAMTIHPRSDTRTVKKEEMLYLYAILKRVKLSPVKSLFEHWRTAAVHVGSVEMTSLVTRIATRMIGIRGARIAYIREPRLEIGVDHFVQGHMLRTNPDQSVVMIYRGYSTEIPLPCPRLGIFNTKRLTLHLMMGETVTQERGQGGPMTRSRARRDANLGTSETQPGPSTFDEAYDLYQNRNRGASGSGHARASFSGAHDAYSSDSWRSQSTRHTSPFEGGQPHNSPHQGYPLDQQYYSSEQHYRDINYISDQVGILRNTTGQIQEMAQQQAIWQQEAAGVAYDTRSRIDELQRSVNEFFGTWNPYSDPSNH